MMHVRLGTAPVTVRCETFDAQAYIHAHVQTHVHYSVNNCVLIVFLFD